MAGLNKIPRVGTPGMCYRAAHFHDATLESPVPTHSVRWVGGQVPENTTAPQPAGSTLALNLNPLGLISGQPPDSWPRVGAPLLAPRIVRWFTVIEARGTPPGAWIEGQFAPQPADFPGRIGQPFYELNFIGSQQQFSLDARVQAWEAAALAAFAGAGGVAVPELSPDPLDDDLFFSRPGTPPVDMALHRVQATGGSPEGIGDLHATGPFLPLLAPGFLDLPQFTPPGFVGADVLNIIVYCNLGPGHGYYIESPASLSPAPDFAGRIAADLEPLRATFDRFAGHRTYLFYDVAPPQATGNPYLNPDGTWGVDPFFGYFGATYTGPPGVNEHLFLTDDLAGPSVLLANYDVEAPLYYLANSLIPVPGVRNAFADILASGLAGLAAIAAQGADVGLRFQGAVSSQSPDPAPFVALIKNHFQLS